MNKEPFNYTLNLSLCCGLAVFLASLWIWSLPLGNNLLWNFFLWEEIVEYENNVYSNSAKSFLRVFILDQRLIGYGPQVKSRLSPALVNHFFFFFGAQPYPFIYILSMSTFVLQVQSWVVAIDALQPVMSKILLSGSLQKMLADLYSM